MSHLDIELARQLLGGRLSTDEAAKWRRHLAGCARCRDLLDNERAFAAVVNLGRTAPGAAPLGRIDALMERVADPAGRRHRQRIIARVVLGAGALLLTFVLAWQLTRRPPGPAAIARELRIGPEEQAAVIANLDALQTLQREPWLADNYETVLSLEDHILREADGPR